MIEEEIILDQRPDGTFAAKINKSKRSREPEQITPVEKPKRSFKEILKDRLFGILSIAAFIVALTCLVLMIIAASVIGAVFIVILGVAVIAAIVIGTAVLIIKDHIWRSLFKSE